MEKSVKIADIVVGERHRKDFGDLEALAASIDQLGLLQSILLTTKKRLVDGERRLRAAQGLGWKKIDARILDVQSLLACEEAANNCHKHFTLSEKVALAKAIREELDALSQERRGAPGQTKIPPEQGELWADCPQNTSKEGDCSVDVQAGERTRDAVAEASGFSSDRQLRRAAYVVEHGIPELVQAMDAGDVKVSRAEAVAALAPETQRECVFQSRGRWRVSPPPKEPVVPSDPRVSAAIKWRDQMKPVVNFCRAVTARYESPEHMLQDEGWESSPVEDRVDAIEWTIMAVIELKEIAEAMRLYAGYRELELQVGLEGGAG